MKMICMNFKSNYINYINRVFLITIPIFICGINPYLYI